VPCTLGETWTPIILLGRGATVGIVVVDGVAAVGSGVAFVDGIDGGSVGGIQASVVGPAQEKYLHNLVTKQ